ncbi:fumarate hydratase [Sphingobacterium sp. WM]|nr:fumarate hydratase [Sphingobacterium sp. WM]WFB62996.1 fumarate hydratase [Sphingobacterium sp. WM]
MNEKNKTYFQLKACLPILLGMLFLLPACQRHSDMQGEGAAYLQGVWVQDSIPGQEQMLNYTLHKVRFICDSVYVEMDVKNSVQSIPDSCYQGGKWKEYAKAVYSIRADSMIVEGVYTRENGKQKISGCYKHGPYVPRYLIKSKSKDSLVLENKFDSRPIVLRKVMDVTCVPKKRWEL